MVSFTDFTDDDDFGVAAEAETEMEPPEEDEEDWPVKKLAAVRCPSYKTFCGRKLRLFIIS